MKKVFIATSRDIGFRCRQWANTNTPSGFCVVDSIAEADIVISVMYDKIIRPNILKSRKCFNFHPGTLPDYKGVGIFTWVLLNQEAKTGVTLHLIDKGVDTGDIIEIREILIRKEDTAHSLFLRGEQLIFKMFKDWYSDLLFGHYMAVPQKPNFGKVYYKKDLQNAKNLTRYAKAFHFPNKEGAYYYNEKCEKIFIEYKKGE